MKKIIFWIFLPSLIFTFHVLPLITNIKVSTWIITPLLILTSVAFSCIEIKQ